MTEMTRVCRKHGGDPLPMDAFPRNKYGPDGYDKMCKQCWKNRPKKTFNGSGNGRAAPKAVGLTEKPSEEEIPEDIERVNLHNLSRLPGDRKFFEWSAGSLTEGLMRYKSLYGVKPRVVYTYTGNFSRYFIG